MHSHAHTHTHRQRDRKSVLAMAGCQMNAHAIKRSWWCKLCVRARRHDVEHTHAHTHACMHGAVAANSGELFANVLKTKKNFTIGMNHCVAGWLCACVIALNSSLSLSLFLPPPHGM